MIIVFGCFGIFGNERKRHVMEHLDLFRLIYWEKRYREDGY